MTVNRLVAVVSHDAGGAEYLSSHLRRMEERALLVLEGPAKAIFRRKFAAIHPVALPEAIERAAWALCGTSWQSDLELRAISLARAAGKRSIAFLDHWVNYRQRFHTDGRYEFPDELWVADEHAERVAGRCIPEVPHTVVGNAYLDDMREEIHQIEREITRQPGAVTVLYICEDIAAHALSQYGDHRHAGYVEEDAMEFFFQNLGAIDPHITHVVLRPHPSEPPDKYGWALGRAAVPVRISQGIPLSRDIAQADVVVGCQSMAMVVALTGGKRVVSCIPPDGRESELPYPQIELLARLVGPQSRVGTK